MMPDLLVVEAMSEAVEKVSSLRPLGSLGSRDDVTDGAATDLTPTATAVLAAIPAWWRAQAMAAGLTGRWLNVEDAVQAAPPVDVPLDPPLGDSWGASRASRWAPPTSRRRRWARSAGTARFARWI
jgi:adenine-specific DNA-methyltransferase